MLRYLLSFALPQRARLRNAAFALQYTPVLRIHVTQHRSPTYTYTFGNTFTAVHLLHLQHLLLLLHLQHLQQIVIFFVAGKRTIHCRRRLGLDDRALPAIPELALALRLLPRCAGRARRRR